MGSRFDVSQRKLGLTQCQQLTDACPNKIEEVAFWAGDRTAPGEPIRVTVSTAINMTILSIGSSNGIELSAMGSWLPGLRNEALFELGANTSNWSYDGAGDEMQFWPMLYGSAELVRPRIAGLLGCCTQTATRELRFFSQADVQCISAPEHEQSYGSRSPRFVINAHMVASRLQAACVGPLFSVT